MTVIGLDVGYSNLKIAVGEARERTAAASPTPLASAAIANGEERK
jgi:hypothetical protein